MLHLQLDLKPRHSFSSGTVGESDKKNDDPGKQKGARELAWMVCRVCTACFGINPAHEVASVTTLSHCAFLLVCLQISIFGQALALKTQQGTKHALFQTLSLSHKEQDTARSSARTSLTVLCQFTSTLLFTVFSSSSKCVKNCLKPGIYYYNIVIRKRSIDTITIILLIQVERVRQFCSFMQLIGAL